MKPTRPWSLVAVAVVTTILGLLVQRMVGSSGRDLPPVPWTAGIGLLLVASLVYSAAVPVRRLTRGSPQARAVDPLRAARTAVLGKAAAYAGALVLGWYLAEVVRLLAHFDVSAQRAQALRAGWTALAALLLCVSGLLAERMCRVPPDDRGRGRWAGAGEPPETDVTGEARRHD